MRISIIGGGIVGLAIARQLLINGFEKITVFEKEPKAALHQSSRNSGVIHSGLYYKPGTLKATLCREGMLKMKSYCELRNIKFNNCGQIVAAINHSEVSRLHDLYTSGSANGLVGLELLDKNKALSYEPNVSLKEALLVPEESIVDFALVAQSYVQDINSLGGTIVYGCEITGVNQLDNNIQLVSEKDYFYCDFVVSCSGLYADRVAKMAGIDTSNLQILPFRGEYYKLKKRYNSIVNGLIYPVPNPSFPFLGVHLTKMIDGSVEAGPNAVLALSREGYRWSDVNLNDLIESLQFEGLRKFVQKYPFLSVVEILRSLSKPLFLKSLQRLVPSLTGHMIEAAPAGVRAQLMNSNGNLEHDFKIISSDYALAVLNAPSPAATSSLAIAEHVVKLIEQIIN